MEDDQGEPTGKAKGGFARAEKLSSEQKSEKPRRQPVLVGTLARFSRQRTDQRISPFVSVTSKSRVTCADPHRRA